MKAMEKGRREKAIWEVKKKRDRGGERERDGELAYRQREGEKKRLKINCLMNNILYF